MEVLQTKISRYRVLQKEENNYIMDLESNPLAYFFPSFSWFMKRKIYAIEDQSKVNDLLVKPKMSSSIWVISSLGLITSNYISKIQYQFDIGTSYETIAGILLILLVILIGLKIVKVKKDKRNFEKIVSLDNMEIFYIKYNLNFSRVMIKYLFFTIFHLFMFTVMIYIFIYFSFIQPNIITILCAFFCCYLAMRTTELIRYPKLDNTLQIIKEE